MEVIVLLQCFTDTAVLERMSYIRLYSLISEGVALMLIVGRS
jgi:hypothetical protein